MKVNVGRSRNHAEDDATSSTFYSSTLSLHNGAPLTSAGALRLGLRSALNDSSVTI